MLAGTLIAWAGAAVPAGYLVCNGAALLRADYPDLFAAIGVTYGAADADHFSLPNLAGRFLQAALADGSDLAVQGGTSTYSLTPSNLPPHAHLSGLGSAASTGACVSGSGARANDLYTGSGPGTAVPFSILPPYTRVRMLIKATNA